MHTEKGHMQIKHKFSGAGAAHIMGFGRRGPLLNQAGDRGGGGTGGQGGTGQGGQGGTGQGGAGGEGGEPALTDAMKTEVGNMVNAAVNGAITNHLTKFKKSFTEEITQTLSSTLSPINETLKTLGERMTVSAANSGKSKDGEVPETVRAEILRQENRIKELESIAKQEREAREQERNSRLREEERGSLANTLRQAGLPDHAVKAAVALLHTEDKRVARTEDGRIVFKFDRGTGAAKYTDELDLDKGVQEWLKTDEGKGFVPARTAAGAGGQPARQGGAPRNQTEAKQQATASLAAMLLGGQNPQ